MKAIILAGGRGVRLWPLTAARPKPLVQVFGVPVIEHALRALKRAGITDIGITLGVMPEKITQALQSAADVSLSFFKEDSPLGTAGSVKAARRFFSDDEDIVIVSGDAVFNLDISAAVRFHKEKNSDATILLYHVSDPSQYGTALVDEDMRIIKFCEKPAWARVYSDMINTGIYVLKGELFRLVPEGTYFDFAKDLFPLALERGDALFGFDARGYWRDIGDPQSYLKCHRDIFENVEGIGESLLGRDLGRVWDVNSYEEYDEASIIPPVYIERTARISSGAQIGPYTVIGSGCEIASGAKIEDSVVLDAVKIDRDALIRGAVADEGAVIGERAHITEDCVLGAGASVGSNADIGRSMLIRCGAEIYSGAESVKITTNGARIKICDDFSPESAIGMGAALSRIFGGELIAVGSCGRREADLISSLIAQGMAIDGTSVLDVGALNYGACAYITARAGCSGGVFSECAEREIRVFLIGEDGLPVAPRVTDALSRALKQRRSFDFSRLKSARRLSFPDASSLYIDAAARALRLSDTGEICLTGRGADYEAAKRIFERIGVDPDGPPTCDVYDITNGKLEIITRKNEIIAGERIIMLCALAYFKEGSQKPFAAPSHVRDALYDTAKKYGGRFALGEREQSNETAALLYDAAAQTCFIACHTIYNGIGADELARELPKVHSASRSIPCAPSGRARLMGRIVSYAGKDASLGDGVKITRPRGSMTLRAEEVAERLTLRAQGETLEAAEEICDFFDELIRGYTHEA